MTKNNLQGKKIIATVTNPLFHDKRMERICSALVEFGAEVTLVGVRRKNVPEPSKQPFEQVRIRTGFPSGFMFYASYNFLMFFYLLFKRFDLLISVDLDTLPVGSLVAGLRAKKRIFDAHEFFTEVPEVERRPFVKGVWELFARLCIGKYNLTVSDSLAKALEDKYGRKFRVIRNLPLHRIEENLKVKSLDKEGEIRLIYIGYLNEGRGLEYLLEAMYLLPENFTLTLAGGGDLEEYLGEKVNELALQDQVRITGWLHPDEMRPYLERAHIGFNLLESRSASYYFSLANKTFDYMQYGIPAIHMDFPEYRLIEEAYSCFKLIDKLESRLLCKTIESISADQAYYEKMSKSNILASKEFTWVKESKKLKNIIARVI